MKMQKLSADRARTLAIGLLFAVSSSACGGEDDPAGAASSSGGTSSGTSGAITTPPNGHTDGVKNSDETDVDCGGQHVDDRGPAPRCAEGQKCLDSSDCATTYCEGATKLCAKPSPGDQVKNGTETGVDCGGPDAIPRCPTGQGCAGDGDCESQVCELGTHTCSAPAKDDGKRNGDESDVDCGGTTTNAPRCATDKACNVHGDCASDGCGYDKKCVANKSCAQHHGGDTCGPENDLGSCCTEIEVSKKEGDKTRKFTVDKYMITAGRFRQFVERTNGDIRGYIQANRPSWWKTGWDDYVPTQINDGTGISHEGVYQELGPWLFFDKAGGNQGCDAKWYGARTYWIPNNINQELWEDEQAYPQDDLDEKALTCATFFMYAAFCAWNGGRLTTNAEIDYIWTAGAADPGGTHRYPWGQNPVPAGWDTSFDNVEDAQQHGTKTPSGGAQGYTAHRYNWFSPRDKVCNQDMSNCDWTVHVSPPGRFPLGDGPFGHSDLAGLLLHVTSTLRGSDSTDLETRKVVWSRSGSWEEAHPTPFYGWSTPEALHPSYRMISKYRASGARCARDLPPAP